MRRPRKVLHILNSAGGGAALSTLSLIDYLTTQGIASAAVCHDAGTPQERQALEDAVRGDVLYTRLYWWNRKIRMPAWKRPLVEARQIVATGWSLGSAARVAEAAERWHADLIHTNTILIPAPREPWACRTCGTCASCSVRDIPFGSRAREQRLVVTWLTTAQSWWPIRRRAPS